MKSFTSLKALEAEGIGQEIENGISLIIMTIHTEIRWKPGGKYKNFIVTKIKPLEELNCLLYELVHEPTGAQILHIANDDTENLFCLGLRTWPDSSNGVAHILEHTVLCGSKKFPIHDPFFSMTRRSLNTFMNAMTGSDFTCYPAASQVPRDFYNLLEVYLDAVFHPFLSEMSYYQEGSHLEFSDPTNPNSPLEYRGVVFNEMKGVMGSPDRRLMETLDAALYPDIIYGYNSGGAPLEIPKLTHKGLIEFHSKYYHPSRCLFFFYGDMPLEGHLDFLASQLLDQTEKISQLPKLPPQPRFSFPKRIEGRYPVGQDVSPDSQAMITLGWVTCHILEQLDLLALSLIETVLLDNDASPLKLALLRSGLCKQVESFLDEDMSEVPFVVSLKGCHPNDADALEKLIRETLHKVVDDGIPKELIDNALHQLEFQRKEITGDGSPFGLILFFRAGLLKMHGGEPEESLVIASLFEQLHKKVEEEPNYFVHLIRHHLLDNPHFVRVVMHADPKCAELEAKQEIALLEARKSELSEEQKQQIISKTAALAEFQAIQEDQDISCLPKLSIHEVPKEVKKYPLTRHQVGKFELFHHNTFTNGIGYAEIVFPFGQVSEEELSYINLFSQMLTQIGCADRSYIENLNYIQAHTGGIWTELSFNRQVDDYSKFYPTFHIRGKALHRKGEKLFTLMKEMATAPLFTDRDRLEEIIQKGYTTLQNSLNQQAMGYATTLSASGLDVPGRLNQAWSGIDFYWFLKDLAQNFSKRVESLIATLERLRNALLCTSTPHLVVTCTEEMLKEYQNASFYGLTDVKIHHPEPFLADYKVSPLSSQGWTISSPVAFNSKVFKTVPYNHPSAPALGVVSNLIDNLVLHRRIREEGGAYGCGAVHNPLYGNFTFYSYRDPNISSTLAAFEEGLNRVARGQFTEEDLEEAQLELIQAMDQPLSPGSRGHLAYTWYREGKTDQVRQHYRDRLLAITKKEAIAAVTEALIPMSQKGTLITFAGKEVFEREMPLLKSQGYPPLTLRDL